jgi:2-polyprenyl-3-methyl-5-hydroxy-6-metoxy-1,4-benzoquinol methylase
MLLERTVAGLHEALIKVVLGLGLPKDVGILDVGCGTGAWLERLAKSGFANLHGIDQDVSGFEATSATSSAFNLDSDAALAADKPSRFGLITAIEVIEHLENPGRLLAFASRYLADDGYLLITTPNIQSVLCRLRFLVTGKLRQFDEHGDPTHISPVLFAALEKVLPRHGLGVVRTFAYPTNGGSIGSRRISMIASSIAATLVPNEFPGDILCVLIRKTGNI